jgi:hypothetical protein
MRAFERKTNPRGVSSRTKGRRLNTSEKNDFAT